jgi:hypothetical protein
MEKSSVVSRIFETEIAVLKLMKKEWTKRSIFFADFPILSFLLPAHPMT